MKTTAFLSTLMTFLGAGVSTSAAAISDTSTWARRVIPLPHEMNVRGIVRVRPSEVVVKARAGAGPLEQRALAELNGLLREKDGGPPTDPKFGVLLGVLDGKGEVDGVWVASAARLKAVPNPGQAYVIEPDADRRLVIAALSETGVYYGARTLCQLLEFGLSREDAVVPLVSVVDWPDLEERGFWHMPLDQIPWLASFKLNHFHAVTRFAVGADRKITPRVPTYLVNDPAGEALWSVPFARARQYAAEVVPGIIHLDFWESFPGFPEAFPELLGQGESAKDPYTFESRRQRVPCASNPVLVSILADLMETLAAQGARQVYVWASEYPVAQCACEACVKEGQYQAEVRAAVAAWRRARRTYPDLRLGVFFGAGGGWKGPGRSYPKEQIEQILAWLPPEVHLGVSMGIQDKVLEARAAAGGWVARFAVVNPLSPWQRYTAGDIQRRVQYLVAKRHGGACQYISGVERADVRVLFDYRLTALAEYAWNANGRSPTKFAAAWATRRGFARPGLFARWIGMMAEPQLAALQSRMSACLSLSPNSWLGRLPQMIAERKMDGAFQGVSAGQLSDVVAACREVLAVARQLDVPDVAREAEGMLRYAELEDAGYLLLAHAGRADLRQAEDRAALQASLKEAEGAFSACTRALLAKVDGWNVTPGMAESLRKSADAPRAAFVDTVRELARQGVIYPSPVTH
ncbi:MAG: hypothetical protein HY321_02610 [Armatimonadetes bacterium]|nr:hypothetical protein [Armatimonadota bacterium]